MVIVQMGNECQLAWTPALQQNFLDLLQLAEDHIPEALFSYKKYVDLKECLFNR